MRWMSVFLTAMIHASTWAQNIGAWCDPGASTCTGSATCLSLSATDGICVVVGCTVDLPNFFPNEADCGDMYWGGPPE